MRAAEGIFADACWYAFLAVSPGEARDEPRADAAPYGVTFFGGGGKDAAAERWHDATSKIGSGSQARASSGKPAVAVQPRDRAAGACFARARSAARSAGVRRRGWVATAVGGRSMSVMLQPRQ